MLCAEVNDAGFKALVERVVDDDVLAVADEFISDMCANISSASGKQPRLLSHVQTITGKVGVDYLSMAN